MELDNEKLITYLKDNWKGQRCPLCQQGNWIVSKGLFELREFQGGGLVVGGSPILVVAPITCDNCGNTVLVNVIRAGLISQPKKKEDKS